MDEELKLAVTDRRTFVLHAGSDQRGTLTVDRWRARAVAETPAGRWEIKRRGVLRRALVATDGEAPRLTLSGSGATFADGTQGTWKLVRRRGRYTGILQVDGGVIRATGERANRSVTVSVATDMPDGALAALTACFAVLRAGWDDSAAASAAAATAGTT